MNSFQTFDAELSNVAANADQYAIQEEEALSFSTKLKKLSREFSLKEAPPKASVLLPPLMSILQNQLLGESTHGEAEVQVRVTTSPWELVNSPEKPTTSMTPTMQGPGQAKNAMIAPETTPMEIQTSSASSFSQANLNAAQGLVKAQDLDMAPMNADTLTHMQEKSEKSNLSLTSSTPEERSDSQQSRRRPLSSPSSMGQAVQTNTSTSVRTLSNVSAQTSSYVSNQAESVSIINSLVQEIMVVDSISDKEINITLGNNFHMLEGAKISITEFSSAPKEYNITFSNLSADGERLIAANLALLKSQLHEKSIIIQRIDIQHLETPTTRFASEKNQEGSNQQQQQQERDNHPSQQDQQEQQNKKQPTESLFA